MRVLRAVVVALVLSAAVIGGAALLGGAATPGTARPIDKRSLLANCHFGRIDVDVDLDTVTYGPMILDHTGGLMLLAITARGSVIECTTFGIAGTNGPHSPRDLPQDTKICEYAFFSVPRKPDFTGAGCAAPDVARIEVVLPDGQVIDVVPENGLFAYVVPADVEDIEDVQDGLVLRAYDEAGVLLQER